MIGITRIKDRSDNEVKVFLLDIDSGNTAKDMMTVPGVYDSVTSSNSIENLKLTKIEGTIGTYTTNCFVLKVDTTEDEQDFTDELATLLTVPVVAARTLMSSYPEEVRDFLSSAMDVIHYYEGVSESSKLCLPAVCFSELPEETAHKMTSVRKSYVLKGVDNQEIFQKTAEDEFGIVLPTCQQIHAGGVNNISSLDILRVTAPYRKSAGPGRFSYRGTYHTPYYKVDSRLMGMIPSDLQWINGFSSNDTLEIQINEKHMSNNLRCLIGADISNYVVPMVSGVFFNTAIGSLIVRLFGRHDDEELIHRLCDDINFRSDKNISCHLSLSDIDAFQQANWEKSTMVSIIKNKLTIADGCLANLVINAPNELRIIDCESIPFTLDISDEDSQIFTELMLSNGYISTAMQHFLINLCRRAYSVHWGHTGATRAIPGFIDKTEQEEVDNQIASYLLDRSQNGDIDYAKYPALYAREESDEEDDEEDEDDIILDPSKNRVKDELTSQFDYYVTSDTIQKIKSDSLPRDYFSRTARVVQSTESSIVEYWRITDGEGNLETFLTSAFLVTGDPEIFIDAFIKLMRWGARKPKLLVFANHEDIRFVFDLNTGRQADNTVIVKEEDLIRVNGCDYSLESFLCTNTNSTVSNNTIIGFVLTKNYGNVKKSFLASWVDLGEIVGSGSNVIGELASIVNIQAFKDQMIPIEEFGKQEHGMYISDSNIQEGLKINVQPKDLSALSLLTTSSVLDSVPYLKSLKNDRIITVKDRQYDILRRYIEALGKFNQTCSSELNSLTNTLELSDLAKNFLGIFKGLGSGKEDANTLTAQSAMQKLSLGGPVNHPVIKWNDTELSGRFILIADIDLQSNFPPMTFSDRSVSAVATGSALKNRVVLLLLAKDGKYILCRKDIAKNEVALKKKTMPDGQTVSSVAAKSYKEFAKLVDGLMSGKSYSIKGTPVELHQSLKEFV